MSTTPPPVDPEMLAAEHALRLLEGDDLARAQRLERSDPVFAAEVADWQERLGPLFDEFSEAMPSPSVWRRIQASVGPANDNAASVDRRLRLWRGYGIAASAVAASRTVVVGFTLAGRPEQAPAPAPMAEVERAPVLVATLASQDEVTSLSVAYDGEQNSLLVSPGRLRGAPGHDHELWIIPAGGKPISLGLVRPGEAQRLPIARELAPHFRQRSAVALSVEPVGGSPTGGPTGPVVASGELLNV
jgi:anti-sigma-K factor RskA